MPSTLRRAVVAVLALAMTMSLTGTPVAGAAPNFRDKVMRTRPNPAVVMRGSGWGHGVGMSQYGAYAQAQAGWGHARILKHYYRGIAVGPTAMPPKIRVGLSSTLTFSNVKAVSGSFPWKVCASGCTTVKRQPNGTTWTVDLLSTGAWRLRQGSVVKWRGGAGKRLTAAFNPAASSTGSVVEAYNPNGARQLYKWGFLEYSPRSVSAGTMYMVLAIPSMELYLRGLGEVPSSWGIKGPAALRAQAVAGRTYALQMHRRANGNHSTCRCSLLATPANQAYTGYRKEIESYGNLWVKAVNDTARQVATYNGGLISTFYSSSHGGRSENVQDSWAYTSASPTPYLRSVDDPWSLRASAGNPYRAWTASATNASFSRFVGRGMRRIRRVRIVGRTAGGSPKLLAVTGLDGTGRTITVNRGGTNGIVAINLRNTYGLRSQQVKRIGFGPFTDDDGSVHEYANLFAFRAGIMERRTATTFAPSGVVTRGRAARYLFSTFALPDSPRDYYSDDNGHPDERYINAIRHAGIVGGRRFNPNGHLTRAQAALFFFRALGLPRSTTDYFDDDDGLSAEVAINAMRRKGLMGGCGTRRFCPGKVVRRGPMATLLLKTVEAYR